ncbi:MAG: acyltransferase family protein [Saprospiraceae bacterium]
MEPSKRLLSLDVFRGITIAGMILVNTPGDWSHVYAPLLHAEWHGCTPTDWVFPFFLFIMGVAIPLALGRRISEGTDRQQIMFKILRRALLIFVIAMFLAGFPRFDLATIRIPGVLTRIALVYLFCSLIFVYLKNWRTQVWLSAAILLGYWALMTLVPVPDGNPPNLQPETNLGAWLDRTVLGTNHLWKQSKVWDPEGLLSTLPAIVTGMIGVFTGLWLKTNRTHYEKLTALFAIGAILVAIGLIWNPLFPINKKIWTSSYVLYVGGLGLLGLGLTYWLVDVLGYKGWIKPFVVFGTNALFAYVMSGFLIKLSALIQIPTEGDKTQSILSWIYTQFFEPVFTSPYNASLAYAIAYVLLILGMTWILYWRKIFIKL